MTPGALAGRAPCIAGLLLLSACAWTERDNRPVWNAFESSMVPTSEGAFYATLPLTIPLGLGAILIDTFVAHPLQVVDDAGDDAVELWRDLDFENHYYTEAGFVPLRAVGTPCVFLGSFLGRSMFVWPSAEEEEQRRARRQARQRQQTLDWLERVAKREPGGSGWQIPDPIDEVMVAAVQAALANGVALERIEVYRAVSRSSKPEMVDWDLALADPSAVVRFHVVAFVRPKFELSAEALRKIQDDPDEAVRDRARARFGPSSQGAASPFGPLRRQ